MLATVRALHDLQCLAPAGPQTVWVGLDAGRCWPIGVGADERKRKHVALLFRPSENAQSNLKFPIAPAARARAVGGDYFRGRMDDYCFDGHCTIWWPRRCATSRL